MDPIEIYKKTVTFCKINTIKDYEKDISLINHYNREKFIEFLKEQNEKIEKK